MSRAAWIGSRVKPGAQSAEVFARTPLPPAAEAYSLSDSDKLIFFKADCFGSFRSVMCMLQATLFKFSKNKH